MGLRARLARVPPGYQFSIGRVLSIYAGLMTVILLASLDVGDPVRLLTRAERALLEQLTSAGHDLLVLVVRGERPVHSRTYGGEQRLELDLLVVSRRQPQRSLRRCEGRPSVGIDVGDQSEGGVEPRR
jgi:hypothetical protein